MGGDVKGSLARALAQAGPRGASLKAARVEACAGGTASCLMAGDESSLTPVALAGHGAAAGDLLACAGGTGRWWCVGNLSAVPEADRVVESGRDEATGWSWRKWAGGAAECWKHFDTLDALTGQYGSFYYNSYVSTLPFAFAEPPQCGGSAHMERGLGFVCFDGNTTETQVGFMLCSPVAEGEGVKSVHLHVRGRWA